MRRRFCVYVCLVGLLQGYGAHHLLVPRREGKGCNHENSMLAFRNGGKEGGVEQEYEGGKEQIESGRQQREGERGKEEGSGGKDKGRMDSLTQSQLGSSTSHVIPAHV